MDNTIQKLKNGKMECLGHLIQKKTGEKWDIRAREFYGGTPLAKQIYQILQLQSTSLLSILFTRKEVYEN